jgi:hypothetical protein
LNDVRSDCSKWHIHSRFSFLKGINPIHGTILRKLA